MKCLLCNHTEFKTREGVVRDNPSLEILECKACGLVFLDEQAHIDKNFYEASAMHESFDFNKWRNDTVIDDSRRFDFVQQMITNKSVMDFGSGNGGFLKEARKVAKSILGVELDNAVDEYYKKDNLPLIHNLKEVQDQFDIITSFHVIEHLKEPHDILEQLFKRLKDNGKLIIEVPNANDALLTIYKNKAFSEFTYWSCHLYLYTAHTLNMLAQQVGFQIEFIKYVQRYPLSNHLYWLSQNKPGGHHQWGDFLDSKAMSVAYEQSLASLGATDTIMALFTKKV